MAQHHVDNLVRHRIVYGRVFLSETEKSVCLENAIRSMLELVNCEPISEMETRLETRLHGENGTHISRCFLGLNVGLPFYCLHQHSLS